MNSVFSSYGLSNPIGCKEKEREQEKSKIMPLERVLAVNQSSQELLTV